MSGRLILGILPHEDIGWKDIGETFIRYTVLKTPWFRVYLHELNARVAHPHHHNHPWDFYTIILWNGYLEKTPTTNWTAVKPFTILYRPHSWTHNVITRGTSWSLVLTGPKKWQWGFLKET